jgi:Nucleotidyl transferase AbiEii toxin, Type IV TA system
MALTFRDYSEDQIAAAKSVLLELVRLLAEYRDDIVVVGGWVPELILPAHPNRHVGTIDVDLALNHASLQEAGYETIQRLLLRRGYEPHEQQPFIFFRTSYITGKPIRVEVDFLAGEYGGTAKSHRTQKIQDTRARKARGCDLAFEMHTEVRVEGTLPEGGRDSATVLVASIVPFLVMKGMALHERLKEKDAWDIYFAMTNYPGGMDALVAETRPHLNESLVREGLEKIGEKFASPEHVGPAFVADFDDVHDPDQRARLMRDAYERINYFLQKLGLRS